jgi:hypothetical protein
MRYERKSRNQRMYHAASHKLNGGPGGIHCSCCKPIPGTTKEIKTFLHRVYRRVMKMQLNCKVKKEGA